jgi:putative thioredoxin
MDQLIGAGTTPAKDLIKDGTQQSFRADVIDASMQIPVIVDFWAPWCGPCKSLGPNIEKAVTEAKGAVRLVKINVDQSQELAAQMRIQSIPAVYAFFQGRPVDGFVGDQTAGQIKQFVQRLAKLGAEALGPSPIDEALEQAEAAFQAGDVNAAMAIFSQVLEHESDNAKAVGGMIRCLVKSGELAQARDFLASLTPELAKDPAVGAGKALLEVAEEGQKASGQSQQLQARVDANPKDFEARHDLAVALFAGGDREAAIDHLLEIVRANRAWNEEAARKQLVKFFEAMGPADPLTLAGRRRLSSLLFA